MNKFLCAFAFIIFFSVSAYGQTNTVTSTVTGTTTVDKTPPTASAPSVVINNQDVCTFPASAAVQTQVLGIAGGIAVRDINCERLKLSRSLYAMGMKVAAVSTLCQDARVFKAMEMAGTPCPYEGLIGNQASEAWAKNPDKRPDYDDWLKEQEKIVKKQSKDGIDEKTAGVGLGILLFLLL